MLYDFTLVHVAEAVIRKYNWARQIGEISDEDINELCANAAAWAIRCDEIAEECENEGYPSHGSNFELRAESERPDFEAFEDNVLRKYPRFAEDDDDEEEEECED